MNIAENVNTNNDVYVCMFVPLLIMCRLIELLKYFYLSQGRSYDSLVAFNENSNEFDFKSVLRAAGIAS